MPARRPSFWPHPSAGRVIQRLLNRRSRDDSGFTIMETVVSIMILGIVMTATTAFFISANRSTSDLRRKGAATQLADDALERAHSIGATRLLTGRDYTSENVQWMAAQGAASASNPWSAAGAWLVDTKEVWDVLAPPDGGKSCVQSNSGGVIGPLCIPTAPPNPAPVIDGVPFLVNTYIGQCWKPAASSANSCTAPAIPPASDIPFYRVVAAVSWQGASCPLGGCIYLSAELLNITGTDAIFNVNQVGGPAPAPVIYNPGAQQDTIGASIRLTVLGGGGSGTIGGWSSTGLPAGLTLEGPSGLIRGTLIQPPVPLTTAKAYSVTLTASDGTNVAARPTSFVWTVAPPPIISSPVRASVQSLTVDTPLNLAVTVTAGTGTAPFTTTSSALPAGISLTSGVLSGTPTTAGSYPISLTVIDKSGVAATSNFTLNVLVAPAIDPASAQSSTVSKVITPVSVTATNGKTPYLWSMSSAPPGLRIDSSSGAISGTPSVAGTYSVTVGLSDASGARASTSFTWTVDPVLAVVNPGAQTSWPTDPVKLSLAATGVAHTLSWSATGLPAGLNLDPVTGIISGTPTTVSANATTVTATDGPGRTAVQSFTWTVKLRSGKIIDNAGLCLEDYNNATAAGSPVRTFGCTGGANQNWTLQADHTIQVTIGATVRCLSATGPTATSMAVLAVCDATQGLQQWTGLANGTSLNLVNQQSSLCLDEPTVGSVKLDLDTCAADNRRSWKLPT